MDITKKRCQLCYTYQDCGNSHHVINGQLLRICKYCLEKRKIKENKSTKNF